jgi:oligopeptidase B
MASISSDTTASAVHTPPTARRDEDRVLYAGAAPPGWNPKHPRQAEDSEEALLDPPVAIPDPYGWMRDDTRKDEQVLEHFKLENDYTEAMTKHLTPLRDTLYQELLSSIQETDYTVPRPKQDYVYYSRTMEGQSYSIHCRAPRTETAAQDAQDNWDGSKESIILPDEHVMLDVNALALDKDYCSTGSITVSPSQKLLAYSVDFTGGETYKIFVKDMASNEQVDHDPELESYSSVVWGADDTVFFYMKMDDTHRPFQLYKHKVGTPATEDVLLKEEPDVIFWSGIGKSKDGKYLFLEHSSSETSESWFLDLQDPNATLQCIAKRRPKVLYEVEHRKGTWWISSNVGGTPNMQLLKAPAKADCAEEWTPVTDSSSGQPLFDGSFTRALSDVSVFHSHVVVQGREGGIPRVWVLSFADREDDSQVSMERLEFEEPAHDVGLSSNREYETDKFAISYDSMVTPPQTMEISFANLKDRTVLKSKKVPGYDKELYGCDRVMVQSRDGATMIPVSMVYRKDVMEQHLSSGNPIHVHQYAYGAYGSCIEADFRSSRLPLLNRGIVYVIAHVRGGGEMGRFWYEEPNGGKYLCKKNTFNDFVDVGRWLVDEKKLTIPDKLSCEGRSAGGLTLGASINQAPELYRMALFGVPFVDVVHTMTDASIPLTANEWEEWYAHTHTVSKNNDPSLHYCVVSQCDIFQFRCCQGKSQ